MGLYHNLCRSPFLPLMHRASELGRFTCPPELQTASVDANLPAASSSQPLSSSTTASVAASGSVNQPTLSMSATSTRTLSVGAATQPIGIPSGRRRQNNTLSSSRFCVKSPSESPVIDGAYKYTRHYKFDDPPSTCIHRLYQVSFNLVWSFGCLIEYWIKIGFASIIVRCI